MPNNLSSPPTLVTSSPFASFKPHHVGLRVPDFKASVDWYAEKLDFRLLHSWSMGDITFGFIALAADDQFCFEVMGGPGEDSRPLHKTLGENMKRPGWHHVCFRVDSVDDTIAELKRRGVTIVSEPRDVDAIESRFAFFSDPWGNFFEVIQPIIK